MSEVYISSVRLTVRETQTAPSRPGKQPRAVWTVSGRTDGLEQALIDAGGRWYKGAYSFWSDPTPALQQLTDEDRLTFAQRQERDRERAANRADRFGTYSQNAAARSESAHNRVYAIAEHIPLGQPILVGHHSEGRHRADVKRIDNGMRTAVEEGRKAEYWSGRASTSARKATAEHTLDYVDRRIKDAEKLLRVVERNLSQLPASRRRSPEHDWDAYEQKLNAHKTEHTDRLEYWRGEMEKLGGLKFDKGNISKGDLVQIRGQWRQVDRVNPTTVSVTTGYSWTDKYPYSQITARQGKADEAGQ